ncbi:uncharacterized protein LOC104265835 [Ciona intestinalis]
MYRLKDCNCLKNYRFNVDDFTDDQLFRLRGICFDVRAGGNLELKKKLNQEIKAQSVERKYFFKFVTRERLNYASRIKFKRLHDFFKISSNIRLPKEDYFLRWRPTESVKELGWKEYPKVNLLLSMPVGAENLSGWDRIKIAIFPKRFTPDYKSKELVHRFNLTVLQGGTVISAMMIGTGLAYEHGKQFVKDHDRGNKSQFYDSKIQALRARHHAFFRGMSRYSFRWGWRAGFLVGSLITISQTMCIYRKQDSVSHYLLGAGIPFAAYNVMKGPVGMLVSGLLGAAVIGLPCGFLMSTCEMNFRPHLFNAHVVPRIVSKHHWLNWTPDQIELNRTRYEMIIHELSTEDINYGERLSHLFDD